jgi:hypothetical protein
MPIDPPIVTIITGGSLIVIANLISYIRQRIRNREEIARVEKNGKKMFDDRDDTAFVEPVTGTFDHIIQLHNRSNLFRIAVQLIFLLIIVLILHNARVL